MTLIAAFDPGTKTGVAWLEDGVFDSAQFDIPGLYQWVDERCEAFSHVQIEKFVINASSLKKVFVPDSLELIGYLKYAAWRCDFQWDMTKPADVMAPFPDEALKRAGWHKPGRGHANDAARHLAHYCVRNRLMPGRVFLP